MTLYGKVINGSIVLDQAAPLPEGARVEVVFDNRQIVQETGEPTLGFLLKYAGCMPDLPSDFAEQHDHYIHGTPKR
jgi:hypothetical protein